ncbi:MAG: biotin--[acetyl-CoA-carboxylase] ligase [Chloroflexota bacterium]
MTDSTLSPSAISSNLTTQFVGGRVLYYRSLPSTMDVAKQAARDGAPEGTIVVADEQTAGRGRLQRQWLTPPGSGIALSIILRPDLACLRGLSMVASLATVRAIQKVTGLASSIKWPNDVLIRGKKVCGILIDCELQGEEVETAIIGLGLNVNLEPAAFAEIADTATSLSAELAREVSRLEVLHSLLTQIERYYLALRSGASLREEWKDNLDTLGKWVRVWVGSTLEEGEACSVDTEGCLIVKRSDGTLVTILAGDVTLRA